MLGKINTYSHLQGEEYHQNWVHRTSGIPTEFKGGIRAVAMDPLEPHKGRYYRTPHAESAQFPSLLLLLTDSQDSLQKNQSIYGQMNSPSLRSRCFLQAFWGFEYNLGVVN